MKSTNHHIVTETTGERPVDPWMTSRLFYDTETRARKASRYLAAVALLALLELAAILCFS